MKRERQTGLTPIVFRVLDCERDGSEIDREKPRLGGRFLTALFTTQDLIEIELTA